MTVFAELPAWAAGLVALGAGAILLFLNYGWLLAVKAILTGRRRKGRSTSDASASNRAEIE
jgi:hypothetical protein